MEERLDRERIIHAVTTASLLRPALMTGDAVDAMAGGHGMLNISVFCAANAIAEEVGKGRSLSVTASNQKEIDMDHVAEAGVSAARHGGADPSNAALITAVLCYLAGSNVRAGIPSGNRKLGAIARLKAGVQRGGVLSLPTPKQNNKISGFPAVLEIYNAMMEGRLISVDGAMLPPGLGGAVIGHSTLGEDHIFPELAENAAATGARGMMKAYRGAAMRPHPLISAVFGTAAALEIVHPEAALPDRYGPSFKVHTAKAAGIGAVKATGLPETLHFRGTGEAFNTADLVGDLGMILKDIGTPTVIGMIAFNDMMACFEESARIGAGPSGGPRNAPLGHIAADAVLALRSLSRENSFERAAEVVARNKQTFMDPVIAHIEANTVARKAEEVRCGEVSKAILFATTSVTRQAIRERVQRTIRDMAEGKTLDDVIKGFEKDRIETIENAASAMMSRSLNKKIEVKIIKIAGGARRSGKAGKRYYVLDPDVDVSVSIDGEEMVLERLVHEVIPNAVLNRDQRILDILPIVTLPVQELLVAGHTLVDLIVPTATAAVLGKGSPEELATEAAARGSIATGGMPRVMEKAVEVARLSVACYALPAPGGMW